MRLIDADAYSDEMRKRQKACLDAFLESTDEPAYTEKEYWSGIFCTFAEAKLTLDDTPTVDAIPIDWLERRLQETAEATAQGDDQTELNNSIFTVLVEWEKGRLKSAKTD